MKIRKQVIFYYFFSNACMPQIMTHTPSIHEFFASIISLLQRILHLVYSIGKKYKAI